MERAEAIKKIRQMSLPKETMEILETLISELKESEDERIRKLLIWQVHRNIDDLAQSVYDGIKGHDPDLEESIEDWKKCLAWLEKQKESPKKELGKYSEEEELAYRLNWVMQDYYKAGKDEEEREHRFKCYKLFWDALEDENFFEQKEQKPIIQDVELNDAVYDYVRDHFIAGADFTPEYIKKLMENAFFAGVDYYLLKQESESCEPDTNVEKVIEDVIRVYGKTQGEWVGGYDIDTLIVNLRRAFNKKEQKPAEWSEDYREEDIQTRFAFYTYKDDPSVLYLSNVFVEETSRNHGFGTRILKAAEKAAEAIGAITICLKVKQDSPANAWYRKNGYGYVTFEDGYDWLEKNLEYLKPAKSAEWSEEDTEMYINVASSLRGYACGLENEEHKKHIKKELDWFENRFKSLRPRHKVEWSEEDKDMLNSCISSIEEAKENRYAYKETDGDTSYDHEIDWLKSLRPSWKPSEER